MAVGELPSWARGVLTPEEVKSVSEAVHRVEDTTRGEVVPVVVRSSTPLRGALVSSVLFFVALFGFLELTYFSQYQPWSFLLSLVVAIVVGLWVGRFPAVQRLLLPEPDELKAVHERAELEFYRLGIDKTQEKTGILVFVSLLEHKVVILADEGIAALLPNETWTHIVQDLVREIRAGRLGPGLTRAIEACGHHLAHRFPLQEKPVNELHNDLVLKE